MPGVNDMQFMQMAPMQKNNQQDQMMKLLQATLARGGQTGQPGASATPQPAQGDVMPGGAMNIVPPSGGPASPGGIMQGLKYIMGGPNGAAGDSFADRFKPSGGFMNPGQNMGLLGGLLNRLQPAQPGAPLVDPSMMPNSGNALY